MGAVKQQEAWLYSYQNIGTSKTGFVFIKTILLCMMKIRSVIYPTKEKYHENYSENTGV